MVEKRRGRPRTVDADKAMVAIVETFRDKGYAATSLDDLTDSTGLSRPSLYRAFGDKLDMYLKAMDAFTVEASRVAIPALKAGTDIQSALIGFYDAMLEIYYRDPEVAPGCLVYATAPCAVEEAIVRERLRQGVEGLDDLFRQTIQIHGPDTSEELQQTALEIASNTLFSISIRAKSGAALAEVRDMAHRSARAVQTLVSAGR